MTSWHSYTSIYNLGHRAVADLLQHDVLVEEKIDGSQFSFGVFDHPIDQSPDAPEYTSVLRVRSKGAEMNIEAPEKMFARGVEYVKAIAHRLHPGWTYRGEFLAKPHHNALSYDRVPQNHIMLFDVNTAEETYLSHEEKFCEAERIGLECVPLFYMGKIEDITQFRQFLENVSCLGGQKVEGVVIKPVEPVFGRDHKALMGKFVSEAFKEVHAKTWGENNPGGKDILALIGNRLNSQARWQKAAQHLKESGRIEDSPRDIGMLIKEIPADVKRECEEEIKQWLFDWAWPHLSRQVTRGMPQWYKDHLLRLQFERDPESVPAYQLERVKSLADDVNPTQKFDALAAQPTFPVEERPE